MILVVGSTGLVGGLVCQQLAKKGVHALVRATSAPEKVAALKNAGIPTLLGDLKDRASLEAACKGVKTVISTASSTLSRAEGDNLQSVDLEGQLTLVDVAKAAGVQNFIFVSFPGGPLDYPLQSAKRAVEKRIKESGMTYTILQPTNFNEVWLGPALGFDYPNAKARVLGSGDQKTSWISFVDVASFTSGSVDNPKAANQTFLLGGPEALSMHEVVKIFEEASGKKFALEHVPEDALVKQYETAQDPMEKSFAALMVSGARGQVIDAQAALGSIPVKLASVRDYAKQVAR